MFILNFVLFLGVKIKHKMAKTYKSTRKITHEIKADNIKSNVLEEPSTAYMRLPTKYNSMSNINTILGINTSIKNDMDYVTITRNGLKKESIVRVTKNLGITQDKMSQLLHMSARTFQRLNNNEPLDIYTSEQTIEMARVMVRAHSIFEDDATARYWLNSPLIVLGGIAPIDLFDTSFGVQMVMDLLGRIEQGVYS